MLHDNETWLIDALIEQAKAQMKAKLQEYAEQQVEVTLFDIVSKIQILSKVDPSTGEKIVEMRLAKDKPNA